jgi:hypothetical protein
MATLCVAPTGFAGMNPPPNRFPILSPHPCHRLHPRNIRGFPEVIKPASRYYSDYLPSEDFCAPNPYLSPKNPTYHTY